MITKAIFVLQKYVVHTIKIVVYFFLFFFHLQPAQNAKKRRRLTKNGNVVNKNVVDLSSSDDDKFAHLDETKSFEDESQKIGKVV